jgi:predicted HNH restriction endonuclease
VGTHLGPVDESTFANDLFQDPVEELIETEEGRRILRLHLVSERSFALVRNFKRTLSDLHCSVCGFDFEEVYGEIGRDFIEAHHTKPVANLEENERVTVKDLLPVCSNCHRMLHRRVPLLTSDELKAHLAEAYRNRSERA